MKVFKEENYIIDKKGKKTAAILPIEKYEELIEDLYDLSVIAERREDPTIPFDKLKEKLRKKGIL